MEAMFNFIPAPIAMVLMVIGFAALAVGAIRLGYKQYVKQWALELVTIAEDSIMGSGQGAKKKAQVFAVRHVPERPDGQPFPLAGCSDGKAVHAPVLGVAKAH